jgi:hypothetical protein
MKFKFVNPFSVPKSGKEILSPEDTDGEVSPVPPEVLIVVCVSLRLHHKVKDVFVHVAHIEDEVSEDIVHHYHGSLEPLFFSEHTIGPGIVCHEHLVTCVVTIKADIVGELEDVLYSQGELVQIGLLTVIVLIVYEQPHYLPVSVSGVGSAEVRQTLRREDINCSISESVENI